MGKGELIGYDGYKKVKGARVHAVASPEALPLSIKIGPGNEHDSKPFKGLMEGVGIRRGRGRPRSKPMEAIGDSAYDAQREI
ncbi:MAG: transposase [Candidatus Bathyarchaeia archaeon]